MLKAKLKTGPKVRKHRAPLPRKKAEAVSKLHAMLRQGMRDRPGKGC